MRKKLVRALANKVLVLEGCDGSTARLLTIKTARSKREVKEELRKSSEGHWMQFMEYRDKAKNLGLDVAIVAHREARFVRRQDVDNIAKVVLDALKGLLFYDDMQVKRLLAYKLEAKEIEDCQTDNVVVSFRRHDPEKQMILVAEDYL